MKKLYLTRILSLLVTISAFKLLYFQWLNAQTTGYIFKPATTVIKLDPNLDHYTSSIPAGFLTNDRSESEIQFFPLPAPDIEPENEVCPTITTPVSEGAASVSGTVIAATNQTIRLYEDGSFIGSVVTNTGSWTITISAPYSLYAGGVLTATSEIIGTNVESSCAQNITVACIPPTAPSVTPTSYTTCYNTGISVVVSNSELEIVYTLKNNTGTTVLSTSVLGTGSDITLTSYALQSSQTIGVYASKSGIYPCESSSSDLTVTVNPLPILIDPADKTICN
ncbi:MAG: hypothetical protein D4R64_10760, partial [Porphyromonadaceae bacterium]